MKHKNYALMTLDALCAGIFSLGAVMVALPALGLPNPLGLCTVAVLLAVGACALWEQKPWLIPTVVGGCGILAVTFFALQGKLPGLALVIGWYARAVVEESLNGDLHFLVCFATALPITVLFWLIMRKFPSLWLVTGLTAGLIGCQAIFLPGNWLVPFLLLFAGLILFLPRASVQGEGRLQAQALAAVLAVPVLGLTLLLGPKANGEWRSEALGYLVQDVQDFWVYHWGDLPALPITSMRSMGLQPQEDRLGGDIAPDDVPVITSSQNLLLRGQALEVYTGAGWEDGSTQENGNFRYDSLLWRGRREEAFGTDKPKDAGKVLMDELLVEVDATLRPLRNFRSIFLPYRTREVEPGRGGSELFFNMQGEVYWQRQPQSSPEYHVKGQAWDFRDKDFDSNMLLLEKALAGRGKDPDYPQAEGRCLQLPDTLPGWVKTLAEEITADCSSPYAKAMALRDYLSETCEYTLTPGMADPSQDFVAAFLTERKGYCTYYASALTVLCRCAGVPARYVTGYGMTANGKRYEATQATAHAWTEIYVAHAGWVPLDALGQEIFQQDDPIPEESPAGGGAMGQAPTPPPATPCPGGLLVPEPETGRFDPIVLLWAIPAILAVGGALAAKALRNRRYTYQYVRRRFSQPDRAAEHCYAGLLGLLQAVKLTPQPGETLLAFWERVAERLPQKEGVDWREPGVVMDRLRFGGRAPTGDEIAALCEAYRALREYVRKSKGLWGRILF